MLAIQTKELTRYYDGLCAVDHLDLEVRPGELYGFLGPNGAGKTTTIRLLTGLIRPTEGTAYIQGVDVRQDPLTVKAQVGVVPQRSNLYSELSARDNLIFTAKLYGLPRRRWRSRADELLEEFSLSERANSPFGALSGGMKRRLTLAAALVHSPSILFLDEPITGLDVRSARQLRQTIRRLRQEGVTILLTTHHIHEAERLADRVGIVVKGRLIAVDTPQALREGLQSERALELVAPSASAKLIAGLEQAESVRHLRREGEERLRLTIRSLDEALNDLAALVRRFPDQIEEIRTMRPSLEDAFVELTNIDVAMMRDDTPAQGRQ